MDERIWLLRHRGQEVAKLRVTGVDFPWLEAEVLPGPGYAAVAGLFAEELRAVEAMQEMETAEWTAAYDRIRAETRLVDPEGLEVAEYLLHIDGDAAWWRCSKEPFRDTDG